MTRLRSRQQGVSLIEAVVAVGVMAFGMLALVGVQATLHGSSDLSRQRTEAMRIAQETMESYRGYAAMDGTADKIDYAEIQTLPRAAFGSADSAYDGRLNTTFFLTVTAPDVANSSRMRPVAVTVDWTDRNSQVQAVELRSLISGVPPELAGSFAIPPAREPWAAPLGRHRAIPPQAKALPNTGQSVFKPPQRGDHQVAWVFNNVTGLVTGVCEVDQASTTQSLTAEDVADCSNNTTAQLVSGFVRFAAGEPTVDMAEGETEAEAKARAKTKAEAKAKTEAEEPHGGTLNLDMVLTLTTAHPQAPDCFDDATRNAATAATRREVSYYCLVYSNDARTWAGRTRIAPRAFEDGAPWVIADTGAGNFKVCRYTPLVQDAGERNIDHPLDYTAAGSAPGAGLTNQNFLVMVAAVGIKDKEGNLVYAAVDCPTEVPPEGDLFNSNTRPHQTGIAPYDNP